MSQIIWNAVMVAVVTTVFDLIFFYCITRREQRRDEQDKAQDAKIKDLENKLEDFRERQLKDLKVYIENELVEIRTDVDHDGGKRSAIYKRMEDDLVNRRDCIERHSLLSESLAKIDCSLHINNAEIAELNKKMAIVDLIAAHLNINIGDRR